MGDEVEVRESASLVQRPKWYKATVIAVSREFDSPREIVGGADLEQNDENEKGEKVPLVLLSRKRQILVRVPQEKHNVSTTVQPVGNTDGNIPIQPPYVR